jgi:hypothetical protein
MNADSLPHEVPAWEVLGLTDHVFLRAKGGYVGACNARREGYYCTLIKGHSGRHVPHNGPTSGRQMGKVGAWPDLIDIRADLLHALEISS